jgi:hypothetical protein
MVISQDADMETLVVAHECFGTIGPVRRRRVVTLELAVVWSYLGAFWVQQGGRP